MRILVPGGAGYIGAHMCKALAAHGHEVVVLDDLSTGHREAVRWGRLVEGSLLDGATLDRVFAQHRYDAVVHFAARSAVGESMREPLAYYHGNVGGTLNLLSAMHRHGVRRLVFSSTAAVFGEPRYTPIDEDHPTVPLSPYGRSKLMIEQMLADHAARGAIDAVALRYFNAAGADADGEIGEAHPCETHLIPLLLKSARGEVDAITLHGDDYPTRDGTCVRDYIHVQDLCEAHLQALAWLDDAAGRGFHALNLGNGAGYSVREVLEAVREVTRRPVPVHIGPRREGDPATLVAQSRRARRTLSWSPRMPDIHRIIETAWRWHSQPAF